MKSTRFKADTLVQNDIWEMTPSARDNYEALAQHAIRFVLPNDINWDSFQIKAGAYVLPFALTMVEARAGAWLSRTIVERLKGGFRFTARLERENNAIDYYQIICTDGQFWALTRGEQIDSLDLEINNRAQCSAIDTYSLFESLISIRHTTEKLVLSRGERRRDVLPRHTYIISIRKPGARGIPSARAQFASILRDAHAVRAHIRKQHTRRSPSGTEVVVSRSTVRAHIRGVGDMLQPKDYVIRND